MRHIPRLSVLAAVAAIILFPLPLLLTSCGGGGLATRSAGNISISAGDNAVVTISHASATQEAQKTVDAGKIAAAANAAVTGQGSAKADGAPAASLPAAASATPPAE